MLLLFDLIWIELNHLKFGWILEPFGSALIVSHPFHEVEFAHISWRVKSGQNTFFSNLLSLLLCPRSRKLTIFSRRHWCSQNVKAIGHTNNWQYWNQECKKHWCLKVMQHNTALMHLHCCKYLHGEMPLKLHQAMLSKFYQAMPMQWMSMQWCSVQYK